MALRRTPAAAAALAALALAPAAARAQDPADLPPPAADAPPVSSGVDLLQKRSYWARSAGARPFVSAVLELGVIYYRPSLALGFGKPHWSWLGIEGYASVSPSGGAEYVGLRAALPGVEIRGGARYAFSTSQYFLEPRASYTRRETELMEGPLSRYVAGEIEVSGSIPLLGGSLFGVATGYAVLGAPEGLYLYEEALHTVMKPPYLYRARLGFMGEMDKFGELRFGAAAEVIGNPGRGSVIVRVGPMLAIALTHHLDAVGTAMVVAATPDRLGLLGADLGQLGLRYRWATGDRWPEFP
ncbi:hypothetical protein [Sorangium cellulosum]|uniref:Uncharacterized protein n=2 Tax=Sorangium cellulosum TaxID=56 RepID=S4XM08_SORCE|nr:hypothetical protein [Sorangium cellulosum]AGP33476.1 hypothetical protein SCE1572_02490 [Sorangium cellulosum So0157-2]